MKETLPQLADDGLYTPEVGPWGEQKYRLVANYAAMFATSMKRKWACRVYIDLFAGAGRARLEGTSHIVAGSPTIALGVSDPFDNYIFCEQDPRFFGALSARVAMLAPGGAVTLFEGDSNDRVADVVKAVPTGRKDFTVLSFCFVDPFKIANLRFDTIRALSTLFIDFLVLLPTYMDAHRNVASYADPASTTMDAFLGAPAWRAEWKTAEAKGDGFGSFVADAFGRAMQALGYKYNGIQDMVCVRNKEKNAPIYHLAFFSRSSVGMKFWKQARRYSKDQLDLF